MKKRCRKPTAAEWIFCLLLIPVGVFFSDGAHYVGTYSCIGLGGGDWRPDRSELAAAQLQ